MNTRSIKAVFAAMLALTMVFSSFPASAFSLADVNTVQTVQYLTAPEGYNEHDYNKCVAFLEQTDENGISNGEKLAWNYTPDDPDTWGTAMIWDDDIEDYSTVPCFEWTRESGEARLEAVNAHTGYSSGWKLTGSLDVSGCTSLVRLNCYENELVELNAGSCPLLTKLNCYENRLQTLNLAGSTALTKIYCYSNLLRTLDVSGCTELTELYCNSNELAELNAAGCTALIELYCYDNLFEELDVSGCSALIELFCSGNRLSSLDASGCAALEELYCYGNLLAELNVSGCAQLATLYCYDNLLEELELSQNPMLGYLNCWGNRFTELDLGSNPNLNAAFVRAEGRGYVGFGGSNVVYAQPSAGAVFDGFYGEDGELISEGEWQNDHEAYYLELKQSVGTVVARFSGGEAVPGDVDGSGDVTISDAISTLRIALQLIDGSGLNVDIADMNEDGIITAADAVLVLRAAMGL